jgi:hypothetical protein
MWFHAGIIRKSPVEIGLNRPLPAYFDAAHPFAKERPQALIICCIFVADILLVCPCSHRCISLYWPLLCA